MNKVLLAIGIMLLLTALVFGVGYLETYGLGRWEKWLMSGDTLTMLCVAVIGVIFIMKGKSGLKR